MGADPGCIRYYDVRRHWTKKIKPHLADDRLNAILVRDFNRYTYGRWGKRFVAGMIPADFDCHCDWRCRHRPPGPRFWRYVASGACHALVNFNLRLAELAESTRPWRILTSDRHSTVWDGDLTLFDLNFLAMGVPPDEAFEMAAGAGGRELRVGGQRRVHPYPRWNSIA